MRFTDEQLNFHQVMKELIDLYYMMDDIREEKLSSHDPKYNEMVSGNLHKAQSRLAEEATIRKLGRILFYAIPNFYPAIYFDVGTSTIQFQYGIKGSYISLSNYDILWLCRLMGALHTDCIMGTIQNAYELKKAIRTEDMLANRLDEAINITPNSLDKSVLRKEIYSIDEHLYIIKQSDKESFKLHGNKLNADLNVSISKSHYETFYVNFDFECNLVLPLSKLGVNNLVDQDEEITSPRSGHTTEFCDVIRYVFAKYYYLFGSFDRIKICNYDPCRRMLMEKKKGAGLFCSRNCRHYSYYAQLSNDQRLCMLRQNAWINRLYDIKSSNLKQKRVSNLHDQVPHKPHLMGRDYCKMCKEQLVAGKCPEMKKRNEKALKIFSQIGVTNP